MNQFQKYNYRLAFRMAFLGVWLHMGLSLSAQELLIAKDSAKLEVDLLEAQLAESGLSKDQQLIALTQLLDKYWKKEDVLMAGYTYFRMKELTGKRLRKHLLIQDSTWETKIIAVEAQLSEIPCASRLEAATQAFSRSEMLRVVAFLESCLVSKNMTKEEEIRGYELVCRAFIALDRGRDAMSALLNLLSVNPEYQVPEQEPEMRYLYRQVKVRPIGYMQLSMGANSTFLRNIYSDRLIPYACPGNYQQADTLSERLGFQAGMEIGFRIWQGFEIALSGQFTEYTWNIQSQALNLSHQADLDPCLPGDFLSTFTARERTRWFSGGLVLKYRFFPFPDRYLRKTGSASPWSPYLYIGGNLHQLVSSELRSPKREALLPTSGTTEIEGGSINLLELRVPQQYSGFLGIGIAKKSPIGYWGLDLSYVYFPELINNPDQRFASTETINQLLFRYGYIDPSFSIQNFHLSLVWSFPLYKARARRGFYS